jgi:phage shock protein A
MKLIDRLARLVKSDAHGILENLEERSLLLKQRLRDAEIELSHKRTRVDALEDEQRRLREEVDRLQSREAALDEDIELAIAGGKAELARFAVARLLPLRATRRELQVRIGEVADSRERLGERLTTQEEELEELRSRVRSRLAELQHERNVEPLPERRVVDEEIELELLRRAARAEGGAA